jgi:hypothetical protein
MMFVVERRAAEINHANFSVLGYANIRPLGTDLNANTVKIIVWFAMKKKEK